jgi:hypothetical protein
MSKWLTISGSRRIYLFLIQPKGQILIIPYDPIELKNILAG